MIQHSIPSCSYTHAKPQITRWENSNVWRRMHPQINKSVHQIFPIQFLTQRSLSLCASQCVPSP